MGVGILETFLILFESDAKEVDEGAKKAKKSTDDLEDSLDKSGKMSDKLGLSLLNAAKNAASLIGSYLAISAIAGQFMAAAHYADALDEASESLGIAVDELDAWGGAAKLAGGSVEGLIGSVKSLSANMSQMDVTGKARVAPFFKELGIQMLDAAGKARPVMELLPEIAEAFEGLDKQQAIGFGRKLGLDDGTIMLLQKGRREVDALIARQKELGTVTAEDAAVAAKFHDALDDTARVFRTLFSIIAGDVLPALTWILEGFQDIGKWMREHEGFVYGFLTGLVGLLTAIAVRAVIAAGALALVNLPFVAMAAAVLAVASAVGLLWDDFQKFSEGAPAMLGPLWETLIKIADIIGYITGLLGLIGVTGFNIIANGEYDPEIMSEALRQLNGADATPINPQSSSSIMSSQRSSSTSVNIGEVKVVTESTDPEGMAKGASTALSEEMKQAIANMDDGVKI